MAQIVEAAVPGGKSDWVAHAFRVLASASRDRELSEKIVLARRQNQHARRARYPAHSHKTRVTIATRV